MEDVNVRVGNNIKYYRLKKGMTQLELANRAGYQTKGAICKIEAGTRGLSTHLIPSIAEALGVSVQQILGDTMATMEYDTEYQKFAEYLPYLSNAQEWQIKAVREILGMQSNK